MAQVSKPCPWCGRKPRVIFPDVDGGATLIHQCKKAGFEIYQLYSDDIAALNAWNDRKEDR